MNIITASIYSYIKRKEYLEFSSGSCYKMTVSIRNLTTQCVPIIVLLTIGICETVKEKSKFQSEK